MFHKPHHFYAWCLIWINLAVKLVILPFTDDEQDEHAAHEPGCRANTEDIQTRCRQQQGACSSRKLADLYAKEGVNPMSELPVASPAFSRS